MQAMQGEFNAQVFALLKPHIPELQKAARRANSQLRNKKYDEYSYEGALASMLAHVRTRIEKGTLHGPDPKLPQLPKKKVTKRRKVEAPPAPNVNQLFMLGEDLAPMVGGGDGSSLSVPKPPHARFTPQQMAKVASMKHILPALPAAELSVAALNPEPTSVQITWQIQAPNPVVMAPHAITISVYIENEAKTLVHKILEPVRGLQGSRTISHMLPGKYTVIVSDERPGSTIASAVTQFSISAPAPAPDPLLEVAQVAPAVDAQGAGDNATSEEAPGLE